MYNTIFARSFSREEQKKFGYGAVIGSLIIAFSLFTVFKPYLGPLKIVKLRLSVDSGLTMLRIEDTSSSQRLVAESDVEEMKPICNVSNPRSDLCEMKGDIRIHGNSSSIFVTSSQVGILAGNDSWSIRPYARKGDATAMGNVKEWSVKLVNRREAAPSCTLNHSIPGIVFSLGGYVGNHFHDFTDVLVPLFLTSHQFHGEVQFMITNSKSWWISKFRKVINHLSKYETIDADKDDRIHCFPSVIVGLKRHKEFDIDPSKPPNGYTMEKFKQFLRSAYSLKRATAIRKGNQLKRKPRLLMISRSRTRKFTNEGEIVAMARSLGYDVVLTEAGITTDLSKFAQIVNSCDVLMGVHGAGLSNIVFLPSNAVLIQILPWGGFEWLARHDFGEPARDMGLKYLEYKIREEESSLIQQYPLNHAVFTDPYSINKQGWGAFKSVFLDQQNVKLDVSRFKATLLEALQLLQL